MSLFSWCHCTSLARPRSSISRSGTTVAVPLVTSSTNDTPSLYVTTRRDAPILGLRVHEFRREQNSPRYRGWEPTRPDSFFTLSHGSYRSPLIFLHQALFPGGVAQTTPGALADGALSRTTRGSPRSAGSSSFKSLSTSRRPLSSSLVLLPLATVHAGFFLFIYFSLRRQFP